MDYGITIREALREWTKAVETFSDEDDAPNQMALEGYFPGRIPGYEAPSPSELAMEQEMKVLEGKMYPWEIISETEREFVSKALCSDAEVILSKYQPHFTTQEERDAFEKALETEDMGTQRVNTNQTMTETRRRSTGTSGDKKLDQGTNSNIDRTPQQWLDDYNAKIKVIDLGRKKLGDRLIALIRTTNRENAQFLQNLQKNGSKPQQQITVMNWSYQHNPSRYLHQKVIRLRQALEKNIMAITTDTLADDLILGSNNADLEEKIMRQIGAPSAVTKYTQFVSWITTQFRGKKTEMTISSHDIDQYVRQITDFKQIETQLKTDLAEIDRCVNRCNSQVRSKLNASNVETAEKNMLMKRMNRVCRLFSMYNNLLFIVYRLNTEYVLNRRAILKRLYTQPKASAEGIEQKEVKSNGDDQNQTGNG